MPVSINSLHSVLGANLCFKLAHPELCESRSFASMNDYMMVQLCGIATSQSTGHFYRLHDANRFRCSDPGGTQHNAFIECNSNVPHRLVLLTILTLLIHPLPRLVDCSFHSLIDISIEYDLKCKDHGCQDYYCRYHLIDGLCWEWG